MSADDAWRAAIYADTEAWVVKAVIGLNLCPFARGVHASGRVRYFVSAATTTEDLLTALATELLALQQEDPETVETSLLVHPLVLNDFRDYNEFLDRADDLLIALALDGELQIASFHPDYQFAGSRADDIGNCTNRSPHPTLHLLRESSVLRATQSMPDTKAIYESNLITLQALGAAGWRNLGLAQSR